MAKRGVLGHPLSMRTQERSDEAGKQFEHLGKLGALIAPSIERKSLYNQQ